jgi:hypothetical protein
MISHRFIYIICILAIFCFIPAVYAGDAIISNNGVEGASGFQNEIDISKPLDLSDRVETIGAYSSVYIDGKTMIYSVEDMSIGTMLIMSDMKENGEIKNLVIDDTKNQLSYISDTVSIKYEYYENGVKESITVTDPLALPTGYTFSIFGDRYGMQEEDGSILIIDSEGSSLVKILQPYAIDNGGTQYDLQYKVDGNRIWFIGMEKLADAKYPVTIDPTYVVVTGVGTDPLLGSPRGRRTGVTSDGRLWVVWKFPGSSGNVPINASYSDNNGTTWVTETVVENGYYNHFQEGLLDSNNNLYAFWRGPGAAATALTNVRLRIRDASTNTWGNIENVTNYGYDVTNSPTWGGGVLNSPRVTTYPACALNSSDYIHCIFTGTNISETYLSYPNKVQIGYTYRKAGLTGTWSTPEILTNVTTGNFQYVGAIAIDGQDTIHISWMGDAWAPNTTAYTALYKYKALNSGWNATEILWQTTNGVALGMYPVIAVNSTNYVHVIYNARTGNQENQTVYIQTRDPLTTAWTPPRNITPYSTFYMARYPSIGVDAGDNITIMTSERNPVYARGLSDNLFLRNISIATNQISDYIKLTDQSAVNKDQRDTHIFNRRWPVVGGIAPNIPAFGVRFVWTNVTGASTGEVWYYQSGDLILQTPPVASFTTNRSGDVGDPLQPILINDTSGGSPAARQWQYSATELNSTAILLGTSKDLEYSFGSGNWSLSLNISTVYGFNISTQVTWVNVTTPIPPPTPIPTTPNPFDTVTSDYMANLIEMVITFGIGLCVLAAIGKIILDQMGND